MMKSIRRTSATKMYKREVLFFTNYLNEDKFLKYKEGDQAFERDTRNSKTSKGKSRFNDDFGDGSEIADDSVFDCLFQFSSEARQCYADAHGIRNSHRGGRLGRTLGKLVPKDYSTWPGKNNSQRAQKCITSLENFLEPLKAVVKSKKRSTFVCRRSHHTLNKTLNGLLRVLETGIKDIDQHVRHQGISLKPLRVKSVNMTRMTSLAAKQLQTSRQAVQLRNFVLLDYLDQVVRDIKGTRNSCFNTDVYFSDLCTI
ncbi:hypothetical protein OS493_025452 [Desmophyllum pertusum]|uniref:Uncharacterized protein n=1 Tax=Desmophyllum pertusum TaxID=174260 RepID=A0A9W9YLA4_9CNID|nr:hypothetical protein OS493_025452 [Desmophyllum pertusum]